MKLTVLFVAIVAVQTASTESDLTADKTMMEKQRFILEIVYRVDRPLLLEEWIKLGRELKTDKALYSAYNYWMVKLHQAYKVGGLLPRGEFFSSMQRVHVSQSIGLFEFFYYAKNYETFVHNVAWARLNVNEGMFIYALTLAVIHREDMKGIILPQIYEIFPRMFLSSKYILQAEKFDWDVFNRQIMLEKELISTYEQDPAADDGWHVENIQVLQKDPMWSSIYSNLKMVWMPVDYTRDIEIMNDDSVLSYFTEDVGLNAYWYYLNQDYSKVLTGPKFNLDKDRRGEWWAYNIQQILARYYMERLSKGLGKIPTMSWHGKVDAGYNPQLIASNGNSYSVRKNYWQIESHQNTNELNMILNYERRIQDIVNSGRFVMKDGTVVDLSQPKSIEVIGDLLQSNYVVRDLDYHFLGYRWYFVNVFLSGGAFLRFTIAPSVLMNYETMLRDPLTYILFKHMFTDCHQFLYQLPPYTNEELLLPGVEILDVKVSKLMTYFDLVDLDVTTLLKNKIIMQDGRLVWDKTLLARQMRLNHDPFQFDIKVHAEKPQKVVVRIFMAPDFDQYGQKISLFMNRQNFMQLDAFSAELVAGENVLLRTSEDFAWTGGDPLTYSELYNYLMLAYDGKYQFQQNISQAHSLFPDRLILPHGSAEGMPMALFFMISPYTADFQQYSTYDPTWQSGIGSGVRHIDNMPFGYPFDRKIDNLYEFLVPNMFLKHVKIYHLEKYNKYFPMKYENYGSFDYSY